MSIDLAKFAKRLARGCGNEAIHLLMAVLVLLTSSACVPMSRAASESEFACEQAEEELLDEEWNDSSHRTGHRQRRGTSAVATLSSKLIHLGTSTPRHSIDRAPVGHLLANGLRAPLRC